MGDNLPDLIPDPSATALIELVLRGRNARTVAAYQGDYDDFGRFLGLGPRAGGRALDTLVAMTAPAAHMWVLGYRASLTELGRAPATIKRRLAALRAAVKLARQLARISWTLEVEAPRVESYRDTRGPGRAGWLAILEAAQRQATTDRGRRNLAIVRLLHDLALRRAEVVSLDSTDVDLPRSAVSILGKGRTGREILTLPPATRAVLLDWLAARGDWPGPLFVRLIAARHLDPRGRIALKTVNHILGILSRAARLSTPCRPHGLRHEAITRALDLTGGDVRSVQRFSRHKNLDVLMVYDDARRDLGGDVARLVADDVSNPKT